jgi:hypothetical protein
MADLSSTIWYRAPLRFIGRDNFLAFFPTPDMSMAAKLNAVMRLTIYFTLLTVLVTRELRVLYIVFVVALLTIGIYEMNAALDLEKKEAFERNSWALDNRNNRVCVAPSPSNPFMNVLMHEYVQNPERADACDVENSEVKAMMKTHFDKDAIRDVDDIFHKKASDRQFYTTPNTGIPNDQDSFANWLYKTGGTCKEGNGVECYSQLFRHMTA